MSKEEYKVDARIWKRESTQEWVLELSGAINDQSFICRHTEPLSVAPEDVSGLPSHYVSTQAAANKAAEEGELQDTQEPVAHLRFWAAQTSDGQGGVDHNEWFEVCREDEVGIDGVPAFPVYASQVAADRAARPVANKAEVEPVAYCAPDKKGKPLFGKGWMFSPVKQLQATMPLYATPPATTGASTAPADPSMPRDMTQAVEWIIGLRARVDSLLDVIEAEREVAAQAGQVAVPDRDMKIAVAVAEDVFRKYGYVLDNARLSEIINEVSPAKESK